MFGSLSFAVAGCLAFLTPPILEGMTARASTFTTLYNFTNGADGADAVGGVIQDASGTIYGETYRGGTATCTSKQSPSVGCGTVFSFSPSKGLKVLASFTGANGAHGNVSLTLVGKTLYGATQSGGANDYGVVFSIKTDGTGFELLHQFTGADGNNPTGKLVVVGDLLYGITEGGGSSNAGVMFSLALDGTYTVLHQFSLPSGANPNVLLALPNGTLAVSTLLGGATGSVCPSGCGAFSTYSPATGKFVTAYSLPASEAQGNRPYLGSAGPGPTLYAADSLGINSLSQKGGFTEVAGFNYFTVGSGPPSGSIYTPGGTLYGLLSGNQFGVPGIIYSSINGVVTDLYFFGGLSDGGNPVAAPFIEKSGSLLGTTTIDGACPNCGTIWQFTP